MKAKTMAIFFAITLMLSMMAVLPAQAAGTSYDMETWTTATEDAISVPVGFTVVPGTGAQITCDTENVAGNTSKKIKIEHTEDVTTTVTVQLNLTNGNNGQESGSMEAYWGFYLASLESEGEDKGAMLKMDRLATAYTSYFQDATYTHWRKMMVYDKNFIWNTGLTVTFSGKGVLYLDDISIETNNTLINAGFEGTNGDGVLAYSSMDGTIDGWKFLNGGGSAIIMSNYRKTGEAVPTVDGKYFVESAEGNYLITVNSSKTDYLQYMERNPQLIEKTAYKVTVSHKASRTSDGGCGFTSGDGFTILPTVSSPAAHWAKGTTAWADKSYTSIYTGNGQYGFSIKLHSRLTAASGTAGIAYFDNVRIEEAAEKVLLTDASGVEKKALENGTIMKVQYEVPVWDGNLDTLAAPAHGGESTNKVAAVAVLWEKKGNTLRVEDIQIAANTPGKIRMTIGWSGEGMADEFYDVGLMPATASFDINVPATGDYELKLFAWDSVGGLKPITENAYTYTTASEA